MANQFKIKNGLVIDSVESELVNVSNGVNTLLSTSNDANENIVKNTTYGMVLESQQTNLAARNNSIGTVTAMATENVLIPEQTDSLTVISIQILEFGSFVAAQFQNDQTLISPGDPNVTFTTLNNNTYTLLIDPVGMFQVDATWIPLIHDQNFIDFYNDVIASSPAGFISNTYSKYVPAHYETLETITFDNPTVELSTTDNLSVIGKGPLYYINPESKFFYDDAFTPVRPSGATPYPDGDWTIEIQTEKFTHYSSNGSTNVNGYIEWYSDGYEGFQIYFNSNTYYVLNNVVTPSPAINNKKPNIFTLMYQYSTNTFSFHCNGILAFSGVGSSLSIMDPFGLTGTNPLKMMGNIYQFRISNALLYSNTGNFTQPTVFTRGANTNLLFNGSIPSINPTTPDFYNNWSGATANTISPANSDYIVQDDITLNAIALYTSENGEYMPVTRYNAFNVENIGTAYAEYPNKYIGGITYPYSVGDVVEYTPSELSITFNSSNSLLNKKILFDVATGDITYGGLVTSVRYTASGSLIASPSKTYTTNSNSSIYLTTVIDPYWSTADETTAVRIGSSFNQGSSGQNAIGIGYYTGAAYESIAIGAYSNAYGQSSIAIGRSSTAGAAQSVALGYSSVSTGNFATALGSGSNAIGYSSVAIGYKSFAYNNRVMALSPYANPNYPNNQYRFSFSDYGQSAYIGLRYLSRQGGFSSTAYTNDQDALYIPDLLRSINNNSRSASAFCKATVIAKQPGYNSPTEWRVWEVDFFIQGTTLYNNNATITIISTVNIGNGGGTLQSGWTPSFVISSGYLNFTFNQSTSANVSVVSDVECKVLNSFQ